jgi:hypothetical protein
VVSSTASSGGAVFGLMFGSSETKGRGRHFHGRKGVVAVAVAVKGGVCGLLCEV